MKKIIWGLTILFYVIFLVPFQSCEPDDDEEECDTCVMAYKPNIYIYPRERIDLSVKLNFPLGGEVIASVPEYGPGWNVNVDTSGLINNRQCNTIGFFKTT